MGSILRVFFVEHAMLFAKMPHNSANAGHFPKKSSSIFGLPCFTTRHTFIKSVGVLLTQWIKCDTQ